jgi:hypothetical protein
MKTHLRLLAALVVASFVYSAPVQAAKEEVVITATAATTVQTSAVITRPRWARGALVWIDVTVGSTLLLDLDLMAYNYTLDTEVAYASNCPTASGITGVSTTLCSFVSLGVTTAGHYSAGANDFIILLPDAMKFRVQHGNVNEATYTVTVDWIK